jgi:prephenate dehydrogenase
MAERIPAAPADDGRTIAILGLGLIGGSLARDLAALGRTVLGYDRDAATLAAAVGEGVVKAALGPDLEGIERAELVVIAVPVGTAPGLLRAVAARAPASLVTDVGSTKRSIVAAADAAGLGERFVGSHPLAGDHRGGWSASRTGLFHTAQVFLCPAAGTRPEALERVEALWRSVGAQPRRIDAATHDRRMAWVSHLPQGAASALADALARSGFEARSLGPGGRDTTRLAASDANLWAGIFLDNADLVAPALSTLERSVAELRSALERRDAGAVAELLERARGWKEPTEA